jgi:type IV secretory pathway TraG/TraD family ATPase VirD4
MSRDKKFSDYFFDSKHSTSHGSAKFAGFWEQRKVLKPSFDGVYIANALRLKRNTSFTNLCLISPTGAGKTTKYILTNVLQKWSKKTSLVIFDPAGEIHRLSVKWLRKKQKFNVVKIDLTELNGEKYNPLLQVTDKSTARIMAQSLINTIYADAKSDAFWTESAISILTLVILAIVDKIPRENQNLAFVNRIINKFIHSQEEVNSLMEIALNEEDFEEYSSFLSNSIKVKQSIIATVKSALYIYGDDVLKHICSTSDSFNLADLRHKRTALFLIQEEHKIPYYKGFWSLFFRQIFEYILTASDGNDIFMFCDEFNAYSPISDFETIISVNRKKRCHISIILQSYEQLVSSYGVDKAKIIFENCTNKLFYGGLSHQSAKIVSDSLGMMTESYSAKGIFQRNHSLQRISRSLMNPDEVRTMKSSEALFISGHHKPIHLKGVKAFYQNRTLKRRSR